MLPPTRFSEKTFNQQRIDKNLIPHNDNNSISISGWSENQNQQNILIQPFLKKRKKQYQIRRKSVNQNAFRRSSMNCNSIAQKQNNQKLVKIIQGNKLSSEVNILKKTQVKYLNIEFDKNKQKQQQLLLIGNFRYMLSPNHLNNLTNVLKVIPNDKKRVSFDNFLKSMQQERKFLKVLKEKKQKNKLFNKIFPIF